MSRPAARLLAFLVVLATFALGGALPASAVQETTTAAASATTAAAASATTAAAASATTAAAVGPSSGTTWFGPDIDWGDDAPDGYV